MSLRKTYEKALKISFYDKTSVIQFVDDNILKRTVQTFFVISPNYLKS